jgi:hypothetical protein
VTTPDNSVVCNTSGAFSQVPGHVDYFVGRGLGIGSLDYCHKLKNPHGFLALYKMDWASHTLMLAKQLLSPPVSTPTGFQVTSAIDPDVVLFKGQLWVAFECLVQGASSSCVAPLAPNLQSIDIGRLTVPAMGILGPRSASNPQIVCLQSASAPTLFVRNGKLYLYWQVDSFDNSLRQNTLVTRGMELVPSARGLMWGARSGERPVQTSNPALTTLVKDVDQTNSTEDHVAVVSDLTEVNGKILAVSSIGGTAGGVVCRSTHDQSPGCWRVGVSVSTEPLAKNGFGQQKITPYLLPGNVVEYPRFVVDPSGRHYMMGLYAAPHGPAPNDHAAPVGGGLELVPIEPANLVK